MYLHPINCELGSMQLQSYPLLKEASKRGTGTGSGDDIVTKKPRCTSHEG
jgi:hypothetical protein